MTWCLLGGVAVGFPLQKGEDLAVGEEKVMLSDEVLGIGEQVDLDLITEHSGAEPWQQLLLLLDYHDEANHTAVVLTAHDVIVATQVREGKRQRFHEVEGRGKLGEWQFVRVAARSDGLHVWLGWRHEMVVPWLEPGAPGRLGFIAEQGASGRAKILRIGRESAAEGLSWNPLFGNNAVLPHGVGVPVWGQAEPGAEVAVRIDDGEAVVGVAGADGRWEVQLPAMRPGGPHWLVATSGDTKIESSDILFGEVWFCSGQSNMLWRLRDADTAKEDERKLNETPNLRVFAVDTEGSDHPLDMPRKDAQWWTAGSGMTRHLSALAQVFGLELQTQLDMPVGVIVSAVGGTRIESWLSQEARQSLEDAHGPYDGGYRKALAQHRVAPSVLFNAMVAPYTKLPVTGFVWYQGESNANRAWHYERQLPALIAEWRRIFPRENEPFLIVELASFAGQMDPNAETWAELREAQARVAEADPAAHLIVAIDHGDAEDIHPASKRPVGERAAAKALRYVYGRNDVIADPPHPVTIEPIQNGMRVVFDRAIMLLPGGESDFLLAQAGEPFEKATELHQTAEDTLEVRGKISAPTEMRYAYKNVALCPLRGPEGLAAAPFRTDKRPMISEGKY